MPKFSLMTAPGDAVSRLENLLSGAALALMALLPAGESLMRSLFGTGIPGNSAYVENLTLWVAFLGALVATRQQRHLALSAGLIARSPAVRRWAGHLATASSAGVAACLAWAAFDFVRSEIDAPMRIGGWLPVAWAEAILPIGYAGMALRFVLAAEGSAGRAAGLAGLAFSAAAGFLPGSCASLLLWPGILTLLASAILGAPIFVALGGAALLLFFAEGVPVAAIPVETYRIIASPSLPTIPLFTLAGYLLAEGGAGPRLVRLFRAWFGWLPGGAAISATLACAFFGTFAGASGVTILALGGLLLPVMLRSGYSENFALGLVTSTGSIGLLFPPSLAVILYGVVAHIAIPDLFRAGLGPGILMIGAVCAYGIAQGFAARCDRPRFDLREALAATWQAKWVVLVPVVALYGIFGGFATFTEAAAITAIYVLVVETLIHRELRAASDVPAILTKSAALVGGVFVILAVAMGLTSYMTDADIPVQAAQWVKQHIDSRLVFLLALNLFLLVVGCLDGFSAIIVAVPLVQPVAAAFGIHPIHLAVIFLVNLELGYLLPPFGMNLFLASLRFERSLAAVSRSTLPFLATLFLVLALITYWPSLLLPIPAIGR